MSTVWNKIDSGLSSIYSNYLLVQERGVEGVPYVHPVVAAGGRLNVTLQYTGDLAEIEALGFLTDAQEVPGLATGLIELANLERLAAHPGVRKMSFALPDRPTLDKSIPDIKANEVWQRSGGDFTGLTGVGVIIGIIDTGVDIHHPFLRETQPPHTSRILRIWDQGLEPAPGDHQPDPAFLSGTGATYGVEYRLEQIMAALGGLGNFRHRDCVGHGTHVASIAAGNGADKFKYIGVAPEARLIVVKSLALLNDPPVEPGKRLRDAVTYILNVAEHEFGNSPVVINYSAGSSQSTHDGLTLEEDFLTFRFDGQPRKCFVTVSGNDASTTDAGKAQLQQHARIKFDAAGTVEIPFVLRDKRTNRVDHSLCDGKDLTSTMRIDLYYPDGPTTLSFALKVPLGPSGFPGGFVPGPALGGKVEHDFAFGQHFTMEHSLEEDILVFTGRGTVRRRKFVITVDPFEKKHIGDDNIYRLQIESSGSLTAHVWCEQNAPNYRFFIDDPGLPEVIIEDLHQINRPGGAKGVITLAAYDAEAPELPLTSFSSRGPLVDYGGSPPLPDKPDIAAPGSQVDAARGRDTSPRRKKKHVVSMAWSGTSMAAPHVAGAAALLLQKNPALTSTQIAEKLLEHARRPATETPEEAAKRKVEFGEGRLNVKAAVDNTT
jgi:subtilisin family serine protease